jgi:hypothetical protein
MRSYVKEEIAYPFKRTKINGRGVSAAPAMQLSIRKGLHYNSPTNGGRSVGIFHLRNKDSRCFLKGGISIAESFSQTFTHV